MQSLRFIALSALIAVAVGQPIFDAVRKNSPKALEEVLAGGADINQRQAGAHSGPPHTPSSSGADYAPSPTTPTTRP